MRPETANRANGATDRRENRLQFGLSVVFAVESELGVSTHDLIYDEHGIGLQLNVE